MRSVNDKLRERAGKSWLEFLCSQLGVNAMQLHAAILDARKDDLANDGGKWPHTSTLRSHFLNEFTNPGRDVTLAIEKGVKRLHQDGDTNVKWNSALHSFDAFREGVVPVSGPLPINVRTYDHAASTRHYDNNYVMLRRNYNNQIVVELLTLDGLEGASGDFRAKLLMHEGSEDREWISFEGFAHATKSAIWGYGVHRNDDGDHECMSFSIARHERKIVDYLAGMVLRRSSRNGAPVAQQIVLARQPRSLLGKETELLEEIQARIVGWDLKQIHHLKTPVEHLEEIISSLRAVGITASTSDGVSGRAEARSRSPSI